MTSAKFNQSILSAFAAVTVYFSGSNQPFSIHGGEEAGTIENQ